MCTRSDILQGQALFRGVKHGKRWTKDKETDSQKEKKKRKKKKKKKKKEKKRKKKEKKNKSKTKPILKWSKRLKE